MKHSTNGRARLLVGAGARAAHGAGMSGGNLEQSGQRSKVHNSHGRLTALHAVSPEGSSKVTCDLTGRAKAHKRRLVGGLPRPPRPVGRRHKGVMRPKRLTAVSLPRASARSRAFSSEASTPESESTRPGAPDAPDAAAAMSHGRALEASAGCHSSARADVCSPRNRLPVFAAARFKWRACCSSARAGRRLPHHSQRVRACMRARVRARARREEHRQSMHRSIGRATTHALKASATRGSAECAATSAPPLAPLPRYPEPLPRKWVLPSGMPGCLAQGQTGARFQGGQAAQTETSARGTFTTTSRLLRITSAYM